jgi:hypothetical protein
MSDETQGHEREAPLVPVEQGTVDFYGEPILVPITSIEHVVVIYVPLRLLCENMNISWPGQRERALRDPVLGKVARRVRITRTLGTGSGTQSMLCIPLEYLPGWLFGINTSRLKADTADQQAKRDKIVRYQEECFRVLWQAFGHRILRQEAAIEPTGNTAIQELHRIVEMSEAMAHMARQQIEFQQQQEYLAQRLNKAGQVVKAIQEDVADVQDDVAAIQVRLGTVEDKLHPHAYITDEQAAHLAVTVKALAELLTEKHGKNQYQGIYNELYRRFGVSGYKLIRRELYDDVLAFLEDWRAAAMKGKQLPGGEEQ